MTISEYWIGYGLDFNEIWDSYKGGFGYIEKYQSMSVHLIEFTFSEFPKDQPLFNLEATFKTLKGCFHEFKRVSLTEAEYQTAGPLFPYEISRGSGKWSFLGEFENILAFGVSLGREKIRSMVLKNELLEMGKLEKELDIISKYGGPEIAKERLINFLKTKKPPNLIKAYENLINQGLENVGISEDPFKGNIEETQKSLIKIEKKDKI